MVLQALVLALGISSALAAGPRGQNLFIAGDGFTLDQAIADAQKERTPQDSPRWRKSGGTLFVCSKDLKALGLRPAAMLSGVVAVRGYLPYDASKVEDWERKLPRAPDAKSVAVCSAD